MNLKKMPNLFATAKILFVTVITLTITASAFSQGPSLVKANTSPGKMKLNKRFYSAGDMVSATLKFGVIAPMYQQFVVFVSPKTGDAEGLQLRNVSATELETTGNLKILIGGSPAKNDGILNAEAGEVITAYYYLKDMKNAKPVNANNKKEADMICEFAFIRGTENNTAGFVINKKFALDPNEASVNAATVLVEGQMPVQIARNQVIVYTNDAKQVKDFLEIYKGKVLGIQGGAIANPNSQVNALPNKAARPGQGAPAATLVEVDASSLSLGDLGQLRNFLGYKQKVYSSDEAALNLVQLCALANLEGFTVSLNPRMQYHGDIGKENKEWEKFFANPPGTGETLPGSFTDTRTNIPKVWNYMAIWDRDNTPVRLAIVDMGFAPDNDFRNAATMIQCEASPLTGIRCAPGSALGPPTVGASLVGGRVWHGTGVHARAAGVLNNGYGTAGTGGQVAVPMIIKMSGAEAYAFSIGGAIRTAVDNGADLINVSGGFPCRALTALGDFSYCDPGVRGAICAVLFPVVQAGAVIACSALGWIPFAGPFLVGGCIAIATSAYITACIAQFALGNPGEVINSAVQFAKSRGVPVVVSAGNFISPESIPAELRPFANLDQRRMTVEEWEIVPAGLPDVICVGAANPASPYANNQVFGARVDVWAPEDGVYMAPGDGNRPAGPTNLAALQPSFGGTSAAAPFVAGLIANAMAINPQLKGSTSSRTGAIVSELRTLLATTAWRSAELPTDPLGRRRNLINPIAFLKAVSFAPGSPIPNFSATVYGDNWNIESTESTDDVTPNVINYTRDGATRNGSIIHIPGSSGAANITDVDRYRINILSTYRPATGEMMQVKLRTPTGSRFGNLTVRGTGLVLIRTDIVGANEEEKIFQGSAVRAGSTVEFSVEGATPDQDNIYSLRIGNAIALPVTSDITVNLTDIATELCPTTLARGDREFGGGPLINVTARLERTADESGLDVIITYRAEETGGDFTTATGEFRQRVFNAAAGIRIIAISPSTSSSRVEDFRGGGAGFEFPGSCNEGVVQDAPVTGGLIRIITVVGDSGGNDVSAGGGCRCDTKIKSIKFNPVTITTTPR
jgi:Subtilase family